MITSSCAPCVMYCIRTWTQGGGLKQMGAILVTSGTSEGSLTVHGRVETSIVPRVKQQ